MNHKQYIDRYFDSLGVDELSTEELLEISHHVANCNECESFMPTESTTRMMIQENLRIIPAPYLLRQRIAASLDAEDRTEARVARVRRVSKPRRWITAASLAACLALIVFTLHIRSGDSPVFDAAIASYVDSEKKFVSTVGAGSTDELAVALINQFGVPLVWDFSSIGLTPQGGRIDKMSDGRVVAYSLYKGNRGSLLCIIDRRVDFHFPSGEQVVKGIHLYRYKGYSIAVTDRYSVFCVMVTDLPVADLIRAFGRLPI